MGVTSDNNVANESTSIPGARHSPMRWAAHVLAGGTLFVLCLLGSALLYAADPIRPADVEGPMALGAAEELGLVYYNVPVSPTEPFETGALERVDALVSQHSKDQILVHCSSSNRVGGWFATHLVRQHGMTPEQAMAVGDKVGITKEAIRTKVHVYLRQMDAD